ncbi:MAG: pyridoxamine 5'-phosphate oxidase family protein [Rhodospirillaceae bacterium]|nr:MAG: pyridoxamine 5'-phosphate oxidase family protein [Rhodospirillaceae bacterium]
MNSIDNGQSYRPSARTRVRRVPQRARYDRAAVHAILDASLLCHVGYVVNGQPFVTPTAFWREGDTVFWHGSAASRMIESVDGAEVCVTVSHLDGLVLARSAFHHSVEYRSVMMFGRARVVADLAEKRRAAAAFIDRLYPGRNAGIRAASDNELKATTFVALDINEVVAKVRAGGVKDDLPDYFLPAWAGVIPFTTVAGAPIPDGCLRPQIQLPEHVGDYVGQRVDAVLLDNAVHLHERGSS